MDYITVSTDTTYLDHTLCFLHTLQKQSVSDITAHVRGVNLSHQETERLKRVYDNIIVINDNTDLSKTKTRLKGDQSWSWSSLSDIKHNSFTCSDFMCYINNMRFDNVCDLLEAANTTRVINMDVDQLFVNPFDINDLFSTGEIITFNENDPPAICLDSVLPDVWIPEVWTSDDTYNTEYPLNDESLIGITNTELTRKFFSQARELMHKDFLNWDADYNTINKLYTVYSNEIQFKSPELKYCDRWLYSSDSIIWNGAGNNRERCKQYRDYRHNILYEVNEL